MSSKEKAVFNEGSWHFRRSRSSATGIYYYDMKNIEKTDLLLRNSCKLYYPQCCHGFVLLHMLSIKLDRIPTKLLMLTENWSKKQLSFHKLESSVRYVEEPKPSVLSECGQTIKSDTILFSFCSLQLIMIILIINTNGVYIENLIINYFSRPQ